MDFDAWVVDLTTGTATHESGFILRVEGSALQPTSISPANFPAELSFADQARLMRCGLETLANAVMTAPIKSYSGQSGVTNTESLKSAATKEREALAKKFADRADKPQRAVLSLKKK